MSREIRFRLWDGERYWYNVAPLDNEEALTQELTGGECEWEYNNQYAVRKGIVEQYTGLRDKNGKEIYEGDIIQETIIADDTTDGTYRYEVYWDEDTLCWSIKGISDIDYHLRDDLWETNASREVIGNIHEGIKE
jgi:uncharacterized phage protein (TIGR01671 family)